MILCEPICDGAQHIPFNSATIKGVLNLVAGDVRILCTHSHWQALMKELGWNLNKKVKFLMMQIISSS